MCLCMSDLLLSAQYSQGPSMLLDMAIFRFYGWVMFHCTCVCEPHTLSFYPSKDTRVSSILWLLQITLQWKYGCTGPFEVALDKYPDVGWLGLPLFLLIAFVLTCIFSAIWFATPVYFCLFISIFIKYLVPFFSFQPVCLLICSESFVSSLCKGPVFFSIHLPYVLWLEHLIHFHLK